MKKIIPSLLFILLVNLANAQMSELKWARTFGSSGVDNALSVVADKEGNTYTTGYFSGVVDFDPDASKTFFLTSGGLEDIFVLKLNSSGGLVWVKRIGSTAADQAYSICMDDWGNLLVTGYFTTTVDFDPDPAKSFLLSGKAGSSDPFVLKLDQNGNFKWVVGFGSNNAGEKGASITTDNAGNVYTTGQFGGTADFDPGSNVLNLTSTGDLDIYISKLDSAGKYVWARQIGGTGFDIGTAIAVDNSGNTIINGQFSNQVDFDPGPNKQIISTPDLASYMLRLNSLGNFSWVKTTSVDLGWGYSDRSVVLDGSGNIFTTGYFRDTTDFDLDTTSVNKVIAKGYWDMFFMKMTSAGAFSWVKTVGSSGNKNTQGATIAIDASNNIYIGGNFEGSVDFNTGTGTYLLASTTSFDPFIAKYNSTGAFVWAKGLKGHGQTRVTADVYKNVYAALFFQGSIDLDPDSSKVLNVSAVGSSDIGIMKIAQCKASSSSMTLEACKRLVLNGITYRSSGSYTQVIPNYLGCDSTISVSLSVTTIDTGVYLNGTQLFTRITGPGYTYQWIDCKNGKQPINGKKFSQFNPAVNGDYAVIITYNNCSDTSACITVSSIGIDERKVKSTFTVYPNPVNNDEINLYIFQQDGDIGVKLVNALGQVVLQKHDIASGTNTLDLTGLPAGIYSMDVAIDGVVSSMKIVKLD